VTPTQRRILYKKFHWSDVQGKWRADNLTAVEELYLIKIAKKRFDPRDVEDWKIQRLIESKKTGNGCSRGYAYLDKYFDPETLLKDG
jgi:hypothetical protein